MTDPRQPGPTDNWSSPYPATYQRDQLNGHVNGYANTEVDDLDGLGQDDEPGIPRGDSTSAFERYWQAPRTLAPDYDDPQTQQGLSAQDPQPAGTGSNGSTGNTANGAGTTPANGAGVNDPTAWWNSAELISRLNDSEQPAQRSGARQPGEAAEPTLGQQPVAGRSLFDAAGVDQGPQPQSDWNSRLDYDPDATVSSSAVTGSWARPAPSADSETVATSYPESEGYSVGSVASTAQARATAAGPARNQKADNGPRRARLMLRHIDPLSTLKFTLVLTIALFVVWMVAVGVLYGILNGMGVFQKINNTINDVNGSDTNVITAQIVFGAAGVIGAINIVLFTALATVGSFIYNLCADMVGGLELTLAERD